MASAIESDELTRVGPGTVMGQLMREYWIPAAKSSELVAGGDMAFGLELHAFDAEGLARRERDASHGYVIPCVQVDGGIFCRGQLLNF